MASPRHSLRTVGREGDMRGLVLVELALILAVACLALVLALMVISHERHQTQLGQFGTELQTFAAAFEAARAEKGRWPATAEEAGPRVLNAGWEDGSQLGGEYGWVPPAGGRPGLITVTAFVPHFPLALTRDDLLAVDRAIDDGDLNAGRFRTGFNGWPVYQVMDTP